MQHSVALPFGVKSNENDFLYLSLFLPPPTRHSLFSLFSSYDQSIPPKYCRSRVCTHIHIYVYGICVTCICGIYLPEIVAVTLFPWELFGNRWGKFIRTSCLSVRLPAYSPLPVRRIPIYVCLLLATRTRVKQSRFRSVVFRFVFQHNFKIPVAVD